ncbi:SulP family inorganic anion transporter [Devosia sp. 63-57]|uniref:SulP family inorganic anion transporter n=1 Tax=Devosia sp. 63-57 TaxID=1895751 RepID=UPI000869747F|nr:SulP family inorganic anion transporter [Devosia sp. 63-57]ODT48043.1 MAG: sodium-independent anion transporter [Pelagibacterium sp. SCN 63-126]ODU85568.1 MAG: sodium-independent anion transporter [Pelagibacterium sp. SCN 63-17]OJX42249.1 MAG: sodium-independent anion transporter [Devosia sp. 63-57]
MTFAQSFRRDWLSNIRGDILSGLVVALALIPEAIGFSIIAGVDPKVGLYASVIIAITISFAGGRPAMISAATAATAVLFGTLVREHGLDYLLAASILAGLIQIVAGWLRVGAVMRFVSRSVMTGFVNALAILIFMAQLPELIGVSWQTYAMIAGGLAIIYLFPRLTRVVPSPLVCILVLTALALMFNIDTRNVADLGALPNALPTLLLPNVPLNLETLMIILPTSVAVAAVGLLESLLTASIVDQMTDSSSNKNRESVGQGIANIASGLFGGMAGCAMIGQSVINVKSGGRTRLSTFAAGAILLFLLLVLGDWVGMIPMPALVAIMIMVSVGTFSWSSLRDLAHHPRRSSIVMLATVITVVGTHNLALGVGVGVLLSGIFFAWKVAQIFRVTTTLSDGVRSYRVEGQLFFASAEDFLAALDFTEPVGTVRIDLTEAHLWDLTGVQAIDMAVLKFRRAGAAVEVIGLNEASATIMDKLAEHDRPGAMERMLGH